MLHNKLPPLFDLLRLLNVLNEHNKTPLKASLVTGAYFVGGHDIANCGKHVLVAKVLEFLADYAV